MADTQMPGDGIDLMAQLNDLGRDIDETMREFRQLKRERDLATAWAAQLADALDRLLLLASERIPEENALIVECAALLAKERPHA